MQLRIPAGEIVQLRIPAGEIVQREPCARDGERKAQRVRRGNRIWTEIGAEQNAIARMKRARGPHAGSRLQQTLRTAHKKAVEG